MKKVLFIIPTLTQTNGVAAFMVNYISKFKFEQFKIEIIYNNLRPAESYIDFFKSKKINTYNLPYVRDVGIKEYSNAIKLFFEKHHDYDFIYSNVSYQTYFFYKEARKYGITNFAIHAHATQSSDNRIKNFLGDILQKKVNRLVKNHFACSKLAGKAMFKNDDFTIINNAIDYKKFMYDEENRKRLRKENNIKDSEKVIGFVGRFVAQKNIFFFIDLIKKLPSNYKVVMIGTGALQKEFVERVNAEQLEKQFIFLNEITNVNEYYSSFDYFLLPSLYEGLPVVGVEAQSNGLPCLFSDTISDECKISNNTVYLDKDNIDDWIEKIQKMSRDKDVDLIDDFNIDVQATKFEEILKEL